MKARLLPALGLSFLLFHFVWLPWDVFGSDLINVLRKGFLFGSWPEWILFLFAACMMAVGYIPIWMLMWSLAYQTFSPQPK